MKTEARQVVWEGANSLETRLGNLRLIAPVDFGPRILFLGTESTGNWFLRMPPENGEAPDSFQLRGGHRLWHAPEHPVRTYQPDNHPVDWETHPGGGFTLRGETETATGLAKEISVAPVGKGTFRIDHRLTNHGLWTIPCAPWALTVLRSGGTAVMPFPARGEHPRDLLPNHRLIPWSYTDFSLPCWKFHRTWMGLGTECDVPQKIGQGGHPGWLAYVKEGSALVKASRPVPGAVYPDFGSEVELFTNGTMIELETLGPLVSLAPDQTTSHREYWTILEGLPESSLSACFEFLRSTATAWMAGLSWD